MAKKKNAVDVYNMICQDCREPNYAIRLKKEHKGMEVKKYCPGERKHTMHKAKKS